MKMWEATAIARLAMLALAALATAAGSVAAAADRYWPPIVDPATGSHTPGRWVWADLVTSDVAAAAGFYGKVFGWTFETYGGKDDRDTYTLVLADGLPIGGMVFDARAMKGDVPSARWIGLVSVADVAGTATAATTHGGKVVVPPKLLGERGETAVLQDPEGTPFGVVRSKNGDPTDYLGDVNEWIWIDLWTGNVAQATAFYSAVLGYEVLPVPAESKREGAHLASGGFLRAGVMRKEAADTSAAWLPYVRVADAQAAADRARAAGGRVFREPVDIGRAIVAIIVDPTGAPVGIAQLTDKGAQQ
jgi:predicted enzyme related to lactoylglutathione lyase